MLKREAIITTTVLVVFGISSAVEAAPQIMDYQGRLTDNSGNPITAPETSLTFTFYDALTGGTHLESYSHIASVTPDADGIFSTQIGSAANPIPQAVFSGNTVYLNVNVGGENLIPRKRVTSSAYAIRAENSDTVDGKDSSDFLDKDTYDFPVDGKVDSAEVADNALKVDSGGDIQLIDQSAAVADGLLKCNLIKLINDQGNETIRIFGDDDQLLISIENSKHILPAGNGSYNLGSSTHKWGDIWATNGTVQTSDLRDKENINSLPSGLDKVLNLNPVSFELKTDKRKDTHFGLVAQEVQEILPEIVAVGDDPDVSLGLRYSELIPVLIKAMQEQQEQISDLKARLSE